MNNNSSAGKIIGQLDNRKQVCDQKLLQKLVCDRKASDTENVKDRNCVIEGLFEDKDRNCEDKEVL